MDSENLLYKTAELIRDAAGCYYFICLQCGKDFENLDDIVEHIEKYFYEPPDDNDELLSPMTINESDWMASDGDVEPVAVSNIKKESFEEYEDYKLSIPEMYQEDNETTIFRPIHCPLCPQTSSIMDVSLESHLMKVHNRTKNHAKIYECKICGRNSFTRSYDLERHQLTHVQYVDTSAGATLDRSVNLKRKRNGDSSASSSVLLNFRNQSDHKPNIVSHSAKVSFAKNRTTSKRYMPANELIMKPPLKEIKPLDRIDNETLAKRSIKGKTLNYCSICQAPCSKNETLASHLIRVHHRNKLYAKVYECKICGKNSFTRPYDLRRHELIHLVKGRKNSEATLPNKIFKTEPKTDDKASITLVPSTPPITKKPETNSVTELAKISTQKQRTSQPKSAENYLCAICNEKFDSCFDVTMHLKFVHNEKRIYKCSYSNCTAGSFSDSFFLHRHELSHSVHYGNVVGDVKNRTKCVFCRRSINKKWNLLKHEKRHLVEMSQQ